MTSDTVDFLMSQPNGAQYVVLYQMLCLKTVNQNGELSRQLGEVIVPYDETKIQRDLKYFSIDTVRVALDLFRRLGLVYEHDNGSLKIADFENLVGSQTISAYKKQIQLENRCGKKVEKIPPYKEKEKDKEIDKDKEKNIDLLASHYERMKEEKKESISSAPASVREKATPYDDLFDELCVAKIVRAAIIEFIKHLRANKITVINSRLERLILALDRAYKTDEKAKVEEIQAAIRGGLKYLPCEE